MKHIVEIAYLAVTLDFQDIPVLIQTHTHTLSIYILSIKVDFGAFFPKFRKHSFIVA